MLSTLHRSLGGRLSQTSVVLSSRRALSEVVSTVTENVEEKTTEKKRHGKMPNVLMNVQQALASARANSWAKFDESVEVTLTTGLDPRKPNQSVKGVARLPHGTGKKIRVCVICSTADTAIALEAGADVAGGAEIIAQIQGGDVNFNTIIATPDMMSQVGKIGRILGPRGLMPNPKLGTVTKDVLSAVKAAKAGAVQFKTERKGVIQAAVGKLSFSDEALMENIRALMLAVADNKPENFKGKFLKKAHLSTTMGPGNKVELCFMDPANSKFMLNMPPSK